MSITEIRVAGQILRLECDDHAKLHEVSEELNAKIEEFKQQNPNSGDFKALVAVALSLQDEVIKLQQELNAKDENENVGSELLSTINRVQNDIGRLTAQLNSAMEDDL